jgi:hypothetical protein
MKQQQQKDGGAIYDRGMRRSVIVAIFSAWAMTLRKSVAILGTTLSFPRRSSRLSESLRRTRTLSDCWSVTGGSHQVSSPGASAAPTPFGYGSITDPLPAVLCISWPKTPSNHSSVGRKERLLD